MRPRRPRVGGASALSLPFPRGIDWLWAGGRSPGSRIRLAAPSRVDVVDPVASDAAGLAGNSGGTAPDFHRTSLDHRPIAGPRISRATTGGPQPGRPRPE